MRRPVSVDGRRADTADALAGGHAVAGRYQIERVFAEVPVKGEKLVATFGNMSQDHQWAVVLESVVVRYHVDRPLECRVDCRSGIREEIHTEMYRSPLVDELDSGSEQGTGVPQTDFVVTTDGDVDTRRLHHTEHRRRQGVRIHRGGIGPQ